MSHNVHASHVSCRPSSAVVSAGVIGQHSSSRSSVAVNSNSGNNNMNHINSSQPASWGHSTNGSSQNAAGLASNQHGASPRTPSGADYDKATTVPSPQSSSGSQGTTLKEHDLLGLSDVSSTNASRLDNSPDRSDFPHEGLNLNLNLGATELRLGPQDDKQSAGFHFSMSGAGAGVPEQGAPVAIESGNFLELDAGGIGTELDTSAADRRSSNVDQKVANSELYQEQGSDRGFSYSSLNGDRASTQGGRAEMMESSACRPLIESESLKKWHGATDRKASNESFSLSMSLVQQQNMKSTTQDDLSEKNLFHNPGDRNYNEAPPEMTVQQQQQQEWQERKQHNVAQDDFSTTSEKGVAQDHVMSEKSTPLDLQQGTEKQERVNHEVFKMDKRNLPEGKALAALQLPEARFAQDMSTVPSPRHPDYHVQQKLWQSQMLMRSQMGAPEFQIQQQQMSLPSQDDSSRNGFTLSHNGSFQGPRGVFLPSKPAVSGAKRAFDTIGTGSESRNFNESRVSSVAESPSMVNANSGSSDADAKPKAQPPSYQAWGPRGPTWQMLHTGGSFGPFPSQAPGRSQIITKPTGEGVSAGGDAAQKAWEAHTKNLQQQDPSTSISQKVGSCPSESKPAPAQAPSSPSEAGSLPRAAAAAAPTSHAVGWPPLRSYRKNSIAAHPRPSPVETQTRPPPPPPPQAASPASVASQPNSWFVKVYMDGVPFGRKVDLKTNRSYEKLSLVLEDMFRGFVVNGQQSSRDMTLPSDKRNFLHGSDYVLTYEDQDGDLMLVGDVPWTMFIDTVKRLRIMKGSEAIGLGTRAAEKANKVQLTA